MITLTLNLCAVLMIITPSVDAFWCYECSSIDQYCNDESNGVDTPRFGSCEGGQCTKFVTVTEDHDEAKTVDTVRTVTKRNCIDYAGPYHMEGCTTEVIHDEDNQLTITTTKCYCNTVYCNAASEKVVPGLWLVLMMAVGRLLN